jgi:hypothetical protein
LKLDKFVGEEEQLKLCCVKGIWRETRKGRRSLVPGFASGVKMNE